MIKNLSHNWNNRSISVKWYPPTIHVVGPELFVIKWWTGGRSGIIFESIFIRNLSESNYNNDSKLTEQTNLTWQRQRAQWRHALTDSTMKLSWLITTLLQLSPSAVHINQINTNNTYTYTIYEHVLNPKHVIRTFIEVNYC